MSLRARLVAAMLALVACGLLAADIATYSSLKSFLISRVDSQLDGAHRSVERAVFGPGRRVTDSLRQIGEVVPGVYVQVRDTNNETLVTVEGRGRDDPESAPKLPDNILSLSLTPTPGAGAATVPVARLMTVPAAEQGGPRYRVSVSALPDGGALVVGLPLRDTAATLHRLFLIEVLVTLLVFAAAAGVGLWLVRLGLRPLVAIEGTAARITAGDLQQRVENADPRSEVGRLGQTLNVMLDRIDVAFTEQQASEAAARASEQRVRQFVADASHELRTPVAAVRAYAELYRMGAKSRPQDLARVLSRIELEAARMGVLVDDLLLLTRLDEGRPLEQAPVDLGGVAAEAVAAARVVEPDRPLSIDVDGSVEVLGDRDRLRQVIDNLLANVRSHTPAEAPADVRVFTNESWAIVEVADRGPGLDPAAAAHVFERFYRADPSRARDSGGSGLGLSIVAAIAHAHGGGAQVTQRDGGGAIFRIRIPLLTGLITST